MWFIAVATAILVLSVIFTIARDASRQKSLEGYVRGLNEFHPTQMVVASDGSSAIAIDEKRHLLCLVTDTGGRVSNRLVPYSGLLACELVDDRSVVMKANRASQVGGAIVGGALLGGVGAVVGALSGSRREVGQSRQIELVLRVNSTRAPTHTLNLMVSKSPVSRDSLLYRRAIQTAQKWHNICQVAMRQGGGPADPAPAQATVRVQPYSPKQAQIVQSLRNMENFVPAEILVSTDDAVAMGAEPSRRVFGFAVRREEKFLLVRCPYVAVQDVQLIDETAKGTSNMVKSLALQLRINYAELPEFAIRLLDAPYGLSRASETYQAAHRQAMTWLIRLEEASGKTRAANPSPQEVHQ